MKISKINYEIINEENDYLAESRAQKMREMANELRAQRDKAREVYEPATQEIGWKKVQVFLENIDKQIGPLFFALEEIAKAEGVTGRFEVSAFTPGQKITKWNLYDDGKNGIGIRVRLKDDSYSGHFPETWVKEDGEPRGDYSSRVFYSEEGIVANTDFSKVLKAIDEVIEQKYNAQLDKMRDKKAYYENSFKKMVDAEKDISLNVLIKNAEKRAEQSQEKGTDFEKDIIKD